MTRTPLMFVALAPLLATAGEGGALQSKVDPQKLQDDVEISRILGAEVQLQGAAQGGQQGEDAGEVQDVLIASDGRIEAVLIEGLDTEGSQSADQPANTAADERVSATQGASSGQSSASVGTVTDEGLTKVQWDKVSYDPAAEAVTVSSSSQGSSLSSMSSGASGMQSGSTGATGQQGATTSADSSPSSMQASSTTASGGGGGESFKATELVGMEVHLSDAKSFGEVDDVLINEQEGKASALVVDAWEGFDRQTYALPVELEAVNREDNAIDYSYTESEVIALQEYERE